MIITINIFVDVGNVKTLGKKSLKKIPNYLNLNEVIDLEMHRLGWRELGLHECYKGIMMMLDVFGISTCSII